MSSQKLASQARIHHASRHVALLFVAATLTASPLSPSVDAEEAKALARRLRRRASNGWA